MLHEKRTTCPEASGRPGVFEGAQPLQSDKAPQAHGLHEKSRPQACFFVEHRGIECLHFQGCEKPRKNGNKYCSRNVLGPFLKIATNCKFLQKNSHKSGKSREKCLSLYQL